jgi:tRNA(Ile2) C34 agmatinyltransferase TiaS
MAVNITSNPPCPNCGSHQVDYWYSMGWTELRCNHCRLRGQPMRDHKKEWGEWTKRNQPYLRLHSHLWQTTT